MKNILLNNHYMCKLYINKKKSCMIFVNKHTYKQKILQQGLWTICYHLSINHTTFKAKINNKFNLH